MISDNQAFDQFVSEYRWAVLTTLRQTGSPVSSVVAYARDGDELVVSTQGMTFKCKTLEQDNRVNLCVITNEEPFNFVSIEGTVTIEKEDLVRSRPETAKVDRKMQNRKKISLLFQALTRELMPTCGVSGCTLVRHTRLVFKNIENTGFQEPEDFEGWLESQQRVILRIQPTRVYGVIR